jgi:hypothetical protein
LKKDVKNFVSIKEICIFTPLSMSYRSKAINFFSSFVFLESHPRM